jgi:hypothetical protein
VFVAVDSGGKKLLDRIGLRLNTIEATTDKVEAPWQSYLLKGWNGLERRIAEKEAR